MMARRGFLFSALGLFGLSGCASANQRRAHPVRATKGAIQQMLVKVAEVLRIPPSLALALAHAESNFDANALSPKGARGLLQIMPATAWGEYGVTPDELWDPQTNARVGLHFLRRLIDQYQGRLDLALSYYNGGSRVGRLPHAKIIPATRPYVSRVLYLQSTYRGRLLRGEI